MKLIVDCALSHPLLALPSASALSKLLAIANIRQLNMPLEAVVAEQFGLSAKPDYPIAAIAANADGLQAGQAYWLRADPVHLLLQRDSFSLSEPVPLQVERAQAEVMIADLNRYFHAEGMQFMLGDSGAWYLRLDAMPQIQTTLPAVAMDRNIYQFMPSGDEASKWLAYMNEIQMLLHDHAVNQVRESEHLPAVNSVWFSGGGVMPVQSQGANANKLVVAANPLYQGLADFAVTAKLSPELSLAQLLNQSGAELRTSFSAQHITDDALFRDLYDALASGKLTQLIIHLGCFEKTLVLSIKPWARFKFWCKRKPIINYL